MSRSKLAVLAIAVVILGSAALQLGCVTTTAMGSTPEPDQMRASANYHFGDRNFVNNVRTDSGISFNKLRGVIQRYRENEQRPAGPIPLARPIADQLDAPADGVRITWIGHSTLLLEFDGFRILTDPVWSQRVSPLQAVGPKRFHEPPIALESLGRIDAVVISHDHYDHLDQATIEQLSWQSTKFFVPLGVGAHLQKWGIRAVHELDWWESVTIERDGRQMELIATPARHFSGRGLLDRNKTLWASWVFRGGEQSVYFGGDTGYFAGFKEIGESYGPFAAALIPIGAYDPAWSDIHLNPEEAAQAYLDLGNAGIFVPIHYATFGLAAHAWEDPMERLLTAVKDRDISHYAFPIPGQAFSSADDSLHQTWWRSIQP